MRSEPMPSKHRLLSVLAAAAAAALLAAPGAAQGRAVPSTGPIPPHLAVGYVANAPNQYAGGSVRWVTGALGGIGIYLDAKFATSSPRNEPGYADSLTAAEVEDRIEGQQLFDEQSEWWTVNAALVRPVSPELMLYAGAGLSNRTAFVQYLDGDRERGHEGFYWVEDEEVSGNQVNLLAGGMFRMNARLYAQFGVESAPRGVTVGLSYILR